MFIFILTSVLLSVTVEAHLLGSQHPGHVLLVGHHQQGHTVQPREGGWRMGRLTVAIIIKGVWNTSHPSHSAIPDLESSSSSSSDLLASPIRWLSWLSTTNTRPRVLGAWWFHSMRILVWPPMSHT